MVRPGLRDLYLASPKRVAVLPDSRLGGTGRRMFAHDAWVIDDVLDRAGRLAPAGGFAEIVLGASRPGTARSRSWTKVVFTPSVRTAMRQRPRLLMALILRTSVLRAVLMTRIGALLRRVGGDERYLGKPMNRLRAPGYLVVQVMVGVCRRSGLVLR